MNSFKLKVADILSCKYNSALNAGIEKLNRVDYLYNHLISIKDRKTGTTANQYIIAETLYRVLEKLDKQESEGIND